MERNEFKKGDVVQYQFGKYVESAEVLEVDGSPSGTVLTLKWLDGRAKGETEKLGTCFLTLIEKAKPTVPTPKFKVGDKVSYTRAGEIGHSWTGTIMEVCPDKFKYSDEIHTGYKIDYFHEGVMKNSGWMSDGRLCLYESAKPEPVTPTSPSVKSAVEAKVELEKKINILLQEYNKTYGVNVSEVNLKAYSTGGMIDRKHNIIYDLKVVVKL